MSNEEAKIVIVKKINKAKKEHHGGAWKIAYADFVTAMMAFFMLLWLLSLLNKYQLQGVSAYFKRPLSDIFVGSKNPEQYKNQVDNEVKEMTEDVGGSANSALKKEKTDDPSVRSEQFDKSAIEPEKESKLKDLKKAQQDNKERQDIKHKEQEEMKTIKNQLEASLKSNKTLKGFKNNLDFAIVDEGLKISLRDSNDNQMFSIGKADFKNYAREVITWLSSEFNQIPKKIVIIGHTDAYQYEHDAKYTNWELSTDRANVVRHLLIVDGMNASKIIRVEGAADVNLLDKKNGDNPLNRRVEIIVLSQEATQKLLLD